MKKSAALAIPMAGLLLAGHAGAQLVPPIALPSPVSGVGGTVGSVTGQVGQAVRDIDPSIANDVVGQVTRSDVEQAIAPSLARLSTERWIQSAPPATLADLRRLRLAELVSSSGGALEMAPGGNPAKAGRLIAIDPTPAQLRAAAAAGFATVAAEQDASLGMRMVVLSSPRGMKAAQARARLAAAAPGLAIEFDHVFEPAGGALLPAIGALASNASVRPGGVMIGMVDGGVARAPSLASASIEQRGFAGAAQPTGHGTAIASLIVGADGKFAGAAPGARLAAADIYGGRPSAGSASTIVRALGWLATKQPSVINISLVGPRNAAVERAVAILLARGIKVVAPVGNDGPAAPPLYPANQAGVIAVTGVDGANRAIREAGRSNQLDYAAPGADMAAALPGRGYARVRGTSFAAPYVSARLAITGSPTQLDRELAKGHGRIGRGVVCATCRVTPKQVGAK